MYGQLQINTQAGHANNLHAGPGSTKNTIDHSFSAVGSPRQFGNMSQSIQHQGIGYSNVMNRRKLSNAPNTGGQPANVSVN